MSQLTNHLGQPIGEPVPDWTPRPRPPRTPMEGRLCRLEALDAATHAAALHEAYLMDREGRNWTYLPYGPFPTLAEYIQWVEKMQSVDDPVVYTILTDGKPVGVVSYMSIDPVMGTIELGHLSFSPAMQRTPVSTEALYLMMRRAFDELGYRRCEWKCHHLNEPSRSAALRLGFRYEGTFRQHRVEKGRNRDNIWFSIIDSEWPAIRSALENWLDPSNFDETGNQRRRLGEFMAEATGAEPD